MRVLLLTIGLLLTAAAPAAGAWVRPVEGPVVGRFRVGADPFAAGQRRGVDLAAAPGARAVAPCSGRVAFVGSVPRFGTGVSVRCGRLTATVLGLGSGAGLPRVGASVRRGEAVGLVGASGRVRLGARVTRWRFGYRDPLRLMGDRGGRDAPLIGPRGGRRRGPQRPAPSPAPVPAAAPRDADAPVLAWIGLALVVCALPGGAIAWRMRRSRVPLARSWLSRPR